jgi:hypothetical protein
LTKEDTGLNTDRQAAAEMKKKRTRSPPSLLAALLPAAGFLLATCLPSFLPAGWVVARAWKGYFTILFKESPRLPQALADLQNQPGILGVVSRYTSLVSVNTFSGYEQIPIGLLASRLDPADPRLDPYLRSIDSYFSPPGSGGYTQLAYVRTERGPLFLARHLARLLAGSAVRWRILELDPVSSLLRVAFAAAAGLLLLLRAPLAAPRWLLWLGLLPWLLRTAAGDSRDLFAFFFLYPLWLEGVRLVMGRPPPPVRKRRPSSRRRRRAPPRLDWALIGPPAVLAGAGLTALLLAAPGPRHLPGPALAAAADLCLLAVLGHAAQSRRLADSHVPFQAVPIMSSRGLLSPPRRRSAPRTAWHYSPAAWVLPLLLAALPLACVPALWLAKNQRDQEVPCLRGTASGPIPVSWASLSRLPLTLSTTELPHLADFVAHRAFQESLGFHRPYGLPRPDERLYLSTYLQADGGKGILQTSRVVKRFSDSWLRVTLASSPPGSLQRLLLDQGRAGEVRFCRETELARAARPLARGVTATLFLLVLLLLEEIGLTAAGLSGKRSFAL